MAAWVAVPLAERGAGGSSPNAYLGRPPLFLARSWLAMPMFILFSLAAQRSSGDFLYLLALAAMHAIGVNEGVEDGLVICFWMIVGSFRNHDGDFTGVPLCEKDAIRIEVGCNRKNLKKSLRS